MASPYVFWLWCDFYVDYTSEGCIVRFAVTVSASESRPGPKASEAPLIMHCSRWSPPGHLLALSSKLCQVGNSGTFMPHVGHWDPGTGPMCLVPAPPLHCRDPLSPRVQSGRVCTPPFRNLPKLPFSPWHYLFCSFKFFSKKVFVKFLRQGSRKLA